MMGVDFDDTPLQPVTISDADGVEHSFEFRSMLVPTGHVPYARERVPEGQDGYEFSVLRDFDANVWDRFKVLYQRVQRGLAVRHVERGELGWRITDAGQLVGRITWDPGGPAVGDRWPTLHVGSGRPDVDVFRGLHASGFRERQH